MYIFSNMLNPLLAGEVRSLPPPTHNQGPHDILLLHDTYLPRHKKKKHFQGCVARFPLPSLREPAGGARTLSHPARPATGLAVLIAMALALLSAALSAPPVAVPLLLPDPQNKNKLLLQPEGLKRLSDVQGPVTVVSAIGQYRSGKSFLLNQLMELPCDAGFQVGHQRETQTKGVWVHVRDTSWSSPNVTTVFLDTEGFEGTGKAAVYDDRIFAFSALIASVLVYNLVETIREVTLTLTRTVTLTLTLTLARVQLSRDDAGGSP